jgi:hypothetical protein
MNRSNALKIFLCLAFFSPAFFYLINPQISQSAPSTNFKDQLSSAQLSYLDTLATGTTAGSSIIYVTGNNYNLDIGDTLTIGSGSYLVKGSIGNNGISLNVPIAAADATLGTVLSLPQCFPPISLLHKALLPP